MPSQKEVDAAFVEHILETCEIGQTYTHDELCKLHKDWRYRYLKRMDNVPPFSEVYDIFEGYRGEQHQLLKRVELERFEAIDEAFVQQWLENFDSQMQWNDVFSDRIYNVRETRLFGSHEQPGITIINCISAHRAIEPFILVQTPEWSEQDRPKGTESWVITLADQDRPHDIALEWLDHFIKQTGKTLFTGEKRALIVDEKFPHLSPEFLKKAQDYGILLRVIPPCTSSIIEPLANGPFASSNRNDATSTPGNAQDQQVPASATVKSQLQNIYNDWQQLMTPTAMSKAWEESGLHPFDAKKPLSRVSAALKSTELDDNASENVHWTLESRLFGDYTEAEINSTGTWNALRL